MEERMTVAFMLFPGVTQLDLTGPAQFLSRMPGANIELVAETRAPVPTDAGFSLLPTQTFDELRHADILCIPGGAGITDVIEDPAALDWVREMGAKAAWVTSVCTGSLVLGAAGLLRGYRATCHWAWHEFLPAFGAEAVHERVVIDRNRITGGGVTAGIDFGLTIVGKLCGEPYARALQLGLEYDPQPPFDSGSPERAAPELVARVARRMEEAAPLRRRQLAAAAAALDRN